MRIARDPRPLRSAAKSSIGPPPSEGSRPVELEFFLTGMK
jgi:hypothetical protein